ncbi:MAG TPA: nuclear transport factor 2 family protein, partial [Candidatus Dormibacteraeota bacterium]
PRFFKDIGSNVEVTEFTPISFTSNETDVIATVRWAHTVNATGKSAAMHMQHWWRFADGKIVFFRGSEDNRAVGRGLLVAEPGREPEGPRPSPPRRSQTAGPRCRRLKQAALGE